jgi:outer membrane protein OmpA-like peptidoglycan-associated protein
VASELVRQGVPATDIVTVGRGEEDLLVPTRNPVRWRSVNVPHLYVADESADAK